MNIKDFRFQELKTRYINAYFEYMIGRLTTREFSEVEVEVLVILLELYSDIYPCYNEFQRLAKEQWEAALRPGREPLRKQVDTPLLSIEEGGLKGLASEYQVMFLNRKNAKINYAQWLRFLGGFFFQLLDATDRIQPYLKLIEENAEKEWRKSDAYRGYLLSKL